MSTAYWEETKISKFLWHTLVERMCLYWFLIRNGTTNKVTPVTLVQLHVGDITLVQNHHGADTRSGRMSMVFNRWGQICSQHTSRSMIVEHHTAGAQSFSVTVELRNTHCGSVWVTVTYLSLSHVTVGPWSISVALFVTLANETLHFFYRVS